jgi:hypothetical protein
MKLNIRGRKLSLGLRIGMLLAAVHFFFILLSVIDMVRNGNEPWHMFWIFLGYVDFPVSILLPVVILPIYKATLGITLPYLTGGMLMPLTFMIFHLGLGSLWYLFLPVMLEKLSKKIATSVTGITLSILLMLLPIFSKWLQLLKFIGGSASCFSPTINSLVPIFWAVFLVWLFLVNSRKKRVLWLLLLAPFVFFYLVHDLYYYITFVR